MKKNLLQIIISTRSPKTARITSCIIRRETTNRRGKKEKGEGKEMERRKEGG